MTDDNLCIENKILGITLYQKGSDVRSLYFRLKAMIENLVDELKHKKVSFEKIAAKYDYEHPTNLNAVIVDGRVIGRIGIVHPVVMKKIDKRASIVFAEIDMDRFAAIANNSIVYSEPSKFPSIEIDLSFVTARFAPIKEAIAAENCELIKSVEVIDIYEDEENSSIAVRLTFSDNTRTLTRDEVVAVSEAIIEDLDKQGIRLKG